MGVQSESDTDDVFDVIHARILRFFPDLVEELGGDTRRLMEQAGIDVDRLAARRAGATYRQIVTLMEVAAAELNCPDFGMQLAMRQRGGRMFGPLGWAMRHSLNFGDALKYVCDHAYAHSLAARIWLRRCEDEDAVFCGHDILLEGLPDRGQAMEQILLLGHNAAMDMTGGHARARRVLFRHQPVSPPPVYRRYFGCEVLFGQSEEGLVYSDHALACPVINPDSRAYEAATSFIDDHFTQHRPPLHAQVRGLIMQTLGTENCSNEAIADALNIHLRTLRRRLKGEGTSFQKIKDEVRRDIMVYYLRQTDLDFAHISEKLGFAEQSVMTRSCNRWFSVSPTQIRAKGRLTLD